MEESDESLQLVVIPWPVMGHIQIVEFANFILRCPDLRLQSGKTLSITVLLTKLPDYIDTVSSSFADRIAASPTTGAGASRLNFIHLPPTDPTPEWSFKTRGYFIHNLVLSQRSNVADYLNQRRANTVGVVVDMLCTSMIGVAEELGIPSYIFFTSPASFLGAMLHFQALHDEEKQDVTELRNSDSDLLIPSYAQPVPPKVLSLVLVDKHLWLDRFLHYARDYRKAKGIIVNTFFELEHHALNSFVLDSAYGSGVVPPVFAVGPILNRSPYLHESPSEILQWLDKQPPSSVLFVCFGSQGSLRKDQVQELAKGLEQSGNRFLWSLRRQSSNTQRASFPSEYTSYAEVLPDGFLERTARTGKVTGWVPQLEVLSHESIGGFISHCGWNSVLESLWCGVPIATWPLHAEQQMNAFQLVKELGLAMEITLNYYETDDEGLILAEEIERGIRAVMAVESEVRKRVRGMKEKSRVSLEEGGSSYISFKRFLDSMRSNVSDLITNSPPSH